MKKRIFLCAIVICCVFSAAAQDYAVLDNGRKVEVREAAGADQAYPFDLEEALPNAPAGYKPFYIEHYGRHGSRFAYSHTYYDVVKKAFDQAEAAGLLTERGASIKADYDRHYPLYHLRMGDLTEVGWNQHIRLGRGMVFDYPGIFSRRDASVFAVSSDSRRAMMSMSAFCLGLGQAAPKLSIREDQGSCLLDETFPRSPANPYLKKQSEDPFPFPESVEEFCLRKVGNDSGVVSRLFTDPDKALKGIGTIDFLRKFFVVVAGMNSLAPEDRTDFSGAFTAEELVRTWEVDNYQRYREYYPYARKTVPLVKHLFEDADKAIEGRRYGAYLRFGHDHVFLPLLLLLRLEGYSRVPSTADEISAIYANIDCPMAANIRFVLYRSAKSDDILVNIRVNGKNARVDGLECVCPGFYNWADYKKSVCDSISAF